LGSLENLSQIRGRGLMIGLDLEEDSKSFRSSLLKDQYVFVGSAMQSNTVRLLPPLGVKKEELVIFLEAFKKVWYA
jgi:acetylornithine aminotransferase